MKYEGKWGTVCDDNWDIEDAKIVCKSLSYIAATSAPKEAYFGKGSGGINMNDV